MSHIACIGHTTIDIILLLSEGHLHKVDLAEMELCLPFPDKLDVKNKVVSLGGNAPNTGAGLIKTGHSVELISQIGEDKLGEILLDELKNWGFKLNYLSTTDESDTSVILSYSKDRTILSYHTQTPYQFPMTLKNVEWLYLSSLGFADYVPLHQSLIAWIKQHPGVELVYNPGRPEIEQGFDLIREIARLVHTFIVNKQEAEKLLGQTPSDQNNIDQIKALLVEFINRGVKRMIITNSKDGAYFAGVSKDCYHIPALLNNPVDTTGAGDAFSGGYLSGVACEQNPLDALRLASAQSGSVVQVPGATNGLLTMKELNEILKQHREVTAQRI